jgi:hypothetical protein
MLEDFESRWKAYPSSEGVISGMACVGGLLLSINYLICCREFWNWKELVVDVLSFQVPQGRESCSLCVCRLGGV